MRCGFLPKDEKDESLFVKEFSKRGIDVEVFNRPGFFLEDKTGYFKRAQDIKDFKGGEDILLGELDLILVRSIKPKYDEFSLENRDYMVDVLRIAEAEGVPVVNSVDSIIKANKKHMTQHLLEKEGVRMPRSLSSSDPMRAMKGLGDREHVIKPVVGSGGLGVVFTENKSTAGDVLGMYGKDMKPVIVQDYVESQGRDIRIIVVGEQVLGAMYRYAPAGMKKSGVTVGGKPEAMEPDSELGELALKCARALGLRIAGVDVIEGKDGYLVLEVNACPGFGGFMEATKINVPEKIIDFLIEEAKR